MYNLQSIYARNLIDMTEQIVKNKSMLDWKEVRWSCDATELDFTTTAEVEIANTIIGHDEGLEALEYALESRAFGQNAFVRGLYGTDRMSMIEDLLKRNKPQMANKHDHCYVANFQQPDRPRLITLKAGEGVFFKRVMKKFADFVTKELNNSLDSAEIKAKKGQIDAEAEKKIKKISDPFNKELSEHQLILVNIKTERGVQPAISPVHEGKPINPQQWQSLLESGKVSADEQKLIQENIVKYSAALQGLLKSINGIKFEASSDFQDYIEDQSREILGTETARVQKRFDSSTVQTYLNDVCEDVIEQFFYAEKDQFYPHKRYSVNVLANHNNKTDCPIIVERSPSLGKLLGTIESKWGERGPELSDHMNITAGTLLRADGGYLILNARDLLTEPGAWKILARTLKNELLEIVPAEMALPFAQPRLKPEPIKVNIRVILLGDAQTYYTLDNHDPDFPNLFKVLADFDSEIKRNKKSFNAYASVISRLVADEGLLHFDNTGVAALIEHGARVCATKGRLTTNFPRIADLAREGHYLAKKQKSSVVSEGHITQAIARTKKRAGLASKKFQERLANGTINLFTSGQQVGQINGLAVIHAGPVYYGFPSRITSTVAPGRAGVIDIESSANMSGSIHTKGFQILGGLLRYLLPTSHPLTFSASIAFEQSYGGIDGDSASGAEFCCLISSITNIPIDQGYAMTGAIDQHGRLQVIGGVNEKIEGFFDTCKAQGFTGNQGVIIPRANAGDLMLRADVQQAVKNGEFSVHAVSYVTEALEILCGRVAGDLVNGEYAEGSILYEAMEKSHLFWKNTNGQN